MAEARKSEVFSNARGGIRETCKIPGRQTAKNLAPRTPTATQTANLRRHQGATTGKNAPSPRTPRKNYRQHL